MELTDNYRIGIDIGSTTLKVCLLDSNNKCLLTDYQRHNANPRSVAVEVLERMAKKTGDCRLQVMMTGSVGMGYAERMGIDFEQEVIAAAEVVNRLYPGVHTLIDMGGEDSKMIFFEEGRVPDMRMNGNCAGGTGSFIDQTATLLGVETAELDALAAKADTIYPIASRCGVFSKTAMLPCRWSAPWHAASKSNPASSFAEVLSPTSHSCASTCSKSSPSPTATAWSPTTPSVCRPSAAPSRPKDGSSPTTNS